MMRASLPWSMRTSFTISSVLNAVLGILLIGLAFIDSFWVNQQFFRVLLVLFGCLYLIALYGGVRCSKVGFKNFWFLVSEREVSWRNIKKVSVARFPTWKYFPTSKILIYTDNPQYEARLISYNYYSKTDIFNFLDLLEKNAPQAVLDESVKSLKLFLSEEGANGRR